MNIKIIGGIADIKDTAEFIKTLGDVAGRYDVTVQALDADKVAGAEHLRFAVEKAMRSMSSQTNKFSCMPLEGARLTKLFS